MSPERPPGRPSRGLRQRVSKACKRCRDQKIRCTGSNPCDQCNKRNSACDFESPSQKVLVTRRRVESGCSHQLISNTAGMQIYQ
ncbi:hypothetical protein N7509_001021 [Penicillium cosmopolitanum]|uniref:Zn(2)-C6 fungal-type domain-containing protein n=1 Tax=Penicillium cosmopolitanum TaxID=1131564 RepID=A0A9X0BES4_9EURO|nr:uncharacterized protein N7509_001021 [Penicillium cosmopolitanum]KAJ5414394.1 hypothetical protein N7509_001021 [Penicillium cosmopolitanum]